MLIGTIVLILCMTLQSFIDFERVLGDKQLATINYRRIQARYVASTGLALAAVENTGSFELVQNNCTLVVIRTSTTVTSTGICGQARVVLHGYFDLSTPPEEIPLHCKDTHGKDGDKNKHCTAKEAGKGQLWIKSI